MSFSKNSQPCSVVAPPPSVEKQKGGTNLDAALSHLRPNLERLLPRAGKDKKSAASDPAPKNKR